MNAVYSFLFIVLSLASVVSVKAAQSASECDPGWERFEHSCYSFPSESVTWQDAVSLCKAFCGKLVEIDSEAENDWVVSQMREKNISEIWIGAYDMLTEGTFRWLSNHEPIGDVPYWHSGQPNNLAKGEHCVAIGDRLGYKWADDECEFRKRFVCETLKCG